MPGRESKILLDRRWYINYKSALGVQIHIQTILQDIGFSPIGMMASGPQILRLGENTGKTEGLSNHN